MKGLIGCLICAALASGGFAAAAGKKPATPSKPVAASKKPVKKKPVSRVSRSLGPPVDPTLGDFVDGDDLEVRRAAVSALGTINGSVVAVDPSDGRVLTIINQKLAFQSGFIPCSTIKLVTSLAALTERVVDRGDFIRVSRYASYDMTTALARSDNRYFSVLGTRLGFQRVTHYAQMLGLGERAGLDIPGEQPGLIPAEPPKYGGVGLMTSFGEGFLVTPLELAALISAIANGGTLHYLQYPKSQAEIDEFTPKIKRTIELAPNGFEDIKPGMRGAVDYGTAKRAAYDPAGRIFGKTGTCTDFRVSTHMGWFGSYTDGPRPLVVVVMLTGTKAVNGPLAAGVAGEMYRRLAEKAWFAFDNHRRIDATSPASSDQ